MQIDSSNLKKSHPSHPYPSWRLRHLVQRPMQMILEAPRPLCPGRPPPRGGGGRARGLAKRPCVSHQLNSDRANQGQEITTNFETFSLYEERLERQRIRCQSFPTNENTSSATSKMEHRKDASFHLSTSVVAINFFCCVVCELVNDDDAVMSNCLSWYSTSLLQSTSNAIVPPIHDWRRSDQPCCSISVSLLFFHGGPTSENMPWSLHLFIEEWAGPLHNMGITKEN